MDRVRFGRALGMGARAAARSAMEAVEAAAAPDPRSSTTIPQQPASRQRPAVLPPLRMPPTVGPAARTAVGRATGPLRQASRALWHEVTGSFFALFALSFAVGVWHTRGNAVSTVAGDRFRFYAFCTFAALFAYFSVSSFVRARRRS